MIDLPDIQTKRLAVKLKPAAEILVKKGHPWIFSDSILKINKEGKAGDLAILFDTRKDSVFGIGLYDPDSPIRIKVLSARPAQINKAYFSEKIEGAFALRSSLLETDTTSYRLIYGESDGFPGLIADVYAEVLVVKLYSSIWYPYLSIILPLLLEVSGVGTLVLRLSRLLEKTAQRPFKDGLVMHGDLKSEVVYFREHGIRFSANVIKGHKTGYFLDHRENRRRVGVLSQGKRVLDVFSYVGGFSVHALAGGAKEVVSLDISAQALEVALANGKLNDPKGVHKTMAVDAFAGLQALIDKKELFDIVVIDPPSFAKSAREVESAKNSYGRLAVLGAQLVGAKGMLVLASCSSRITSRQFFDISENGILKGGRQFRLEDKSFHDDDHPIHFPEAAYLKCGYYRLD